MNAKMLSKAFYCGGVAIVASTAAMSFFYLVDPILGALSSLAALLALSIASLVLTLDRVIPWKRGLAFTVACCIIVASIVDTQWPLRVAFHFAETDCDRIADELLAGQPVHLPARVGVFRIEECEVRSDHIACLWTTRDPSGRRGFIRPASAELSPWWGDALDSRWQAVVED